MTTVEDVDRVRGACCLCHRVEPSDELHHSVVLLTNVHTICLAAGVMRNDPTAVQLGEELCP